jgi:hypothetical protein
MSWTLSVLYRKLVIETHSEAAVICVALYVLCRGCQALLGDQALPLLPPTLLLAAFIFDTRRNRNPN